jgi:hypothetical protein
MRWWLTSSSGRVGGFSSGFIWDCHYEKSYISLRSLSSRVELFSFVLCYDPTLQSCSQAPFSRTWKEKAVYTDKWTKSKQATVIANFNVLFDIEDLPPVIQTFLNKHGIRSECWHKYHFTALLSRRFHGDTINWKPNGPQACLKCRLDKAVGVRVSHDEYKNIPKN